jgi:hypothetical protein
MAGYKRARTMSTLLATAPTEKGTWARFAGLRLVEGGLNEGSDAGARVSFDGFTRV